MKMNLWRAVAASLPAAVLLGSTVASDAASGAPARVYFPQYRQVRPFGARPFASTPMVLGGGATLPIPAYLGHSESSGTTSFGDPGSLFGFFASQSNGLNVEYCATGSGKGKGIFAGPAGTVNIPCSNAANPMATTFGFGPPGGSNLPYPALAGSDAPLTQSDYSTFETNNHNTQLEPVEIPSIFGAVAIYYKPPSGITQRVNLTEEQICKIYDGALRNFPGSSTPVTPVYRSDGSGTSFNFSNHLANSAGNSPDCKNFGANQTFTLADPVLPSYAVGANGNAGVVAAVQSGPPGSLGYAEAGYITSPAPGTNYALVDGKNPVKNLPEAAASLRYALGSTVFADQAVIETAGHAGGPANPAGHTPLSGVPVTGCIQLINPSAVARPSAGYPIVAATYLLFYHNGNMGHNSGLRQLVTDLNTPTDFAPGKITTINRATTAAGTGTTGYAALGSTFNVPFERTATTCIDP